MNWLKRNKKILVLICILALAAFLRFFKVSDLFVFSGDEEHQMSLAASIVKNFHIEWVGVSSADTGFYLGPFWIYFGALWLFLSRGDPQTLALIGPAVGVLTTAVLYLTAKKLFNFKTAIVSSFLYASLPLLVYYDKKFWNPHPTAIVILLLLFFLHNTKKSKIFWIIVAFLYGFVFHVHLSLVPLGAVLAYFFFKDKKARTKRIVLSCIVSFLIIVSPLLAFDYFTKGQNILSPLRLAGQVRQNPQRVNILSHTKQFIISLSRLFYLSPYASNSDEVLHHCSLDFTMSEFHTPGVTTSATRSKAAVSFLAVLILLKFLSDKTTWKKENRRMLGLFSLAVAIPYILLPNIALEYYLLGFFPVYLIIVGVIFSDLPRFAGYFYLSIFFILAILGINTVLHASDDFGLTNKKELITEISAYLKEKSFELSADGICHKYEGWRFLFNVYGNTPAKSFTDNSLGWIYKNEISEVRPDFLVIIYESRVLPSINPNYLFTVKKGGFEGYVYKN